MCVRAVGNHTSRRSLQNANIQDAPSDDDHGCTRRGRGCRGHRGRFRRTDELDGDDPDACNTEQDHAPRAEIGDAAESRLVEDALPEHGLRLELGVELRLGLLGACTRRDLPVIGHAG